MVERSIGIVGQLIPSVSTSTTWPLKKSARFLAWRSSPEDATGSAGAISEMFDSGVESVLAASVGAWALSLVPAGDRRHRCGRLHNRFGWCGGRWRDRTAGGFQQQLTVPSQCLGNCLLQQSRSALHHAHPVASDLHHHSIGIQPYQVGLLGQQHSSRR